ncbi:MAG: type II secretion system ATPase GspE [Planctomycetes bacterium]|nr:type II secretion system ATPase GspE [Planctomycetota bacterium]
MDIARVLLDKGLVSPEQVARATELGKAEALRVDRALIKLGAASEDAVLGAFAEQLGMTVVDLSNMVIPPEVIDCIPSRVVYRKKVLPISRDNGTLTVATGDPFDLYSVDELRLITGLDIRAVLAPAEEVDKLIKTYYGVGGDTIDQMMKGDDLQVVSAIDESAEDLMEQAQEASVIKLVNEIFIEALHERASDIHIEPYEKDLAVRYRIDGVLHNANVPPEIRRFQAAIISRIKIMAHMNIAEKRLPQDGRISINAGGRQIDVRVSVIPMLFGEGIVMRILDKATVLYTLPQLGMAEDTFGVFQDQIQRPHGIILVTGPTGSGKTTTLYAALSAIVSPEIKVLTVEDPVEYHLNGVNQIQVHTKIGLTFAHGLRSILRHDPDVVMIGEIRDYETAEAAIQASLTGHLVFSTLHTNDACSSATRLVDIGVEPYLVTSTLESAMAQRLVRTICTECKAPYHPDPEQLPADFKFEPGQVLYRGLGCRKCRGTGYYGRTGLYELMVASDAIRERIMARASASEIVRAAHESGLRLLREDGWLKVRAGLTTPEEVVQNTKV